MLKSDYKFQDKEVRDFYYRVAMKRPSERNRGGGARVLKKGLFDIDEINDILDILFYYRGELIENRKFKYLNVLEKVRSCIFEQIYTYNKKEFGELIIPDSERGRQLVESSVLPRRIRSICSMFESILNGKENELAQYIFSL